MSKIYGEAVPTPVAAHPFAAVLYSDRREISRAGANSRDEAERTVRYFLEKLETFARKGLQDDGID